jgi:PAS domain S-box-containing protein
LRSSAFIGLPWPRNAAGIGNRVIAAPGTGTVDASVRHLLPMEKPAGKCGRRPNDAFTPPRDKFIPIARRKVMEDTSQALGAAASLDRSLDDGARQFALLLRSVTDYAIYMLDADGYVRSWNPGGERIKGYTADEIVGRHFSTFYPPEDVEAGLPAHGLAVARSEGRFAAEGWRVRKDGTRFHASVVIDPIFENDALLGYAKITRDITEKYEAQQAVQQAQRALDHSRKLEAIGKLTLGLAHDFNNLLTVVINSLDLIARRPGADARTRELVETALQASDRGALLTRQLLAFGRGQMLAPERVEVAELLDRSMELYRRAAGSELTLEVDVPPQLPAVEIDKAQFEAAVLNLVSNSRDAMPHGGRITIGAQCGPMTNPAEPASDPRDHVCIFVADDGDGIPADVQERVFEPFFTTKEIGRGSGLGLSQVFGFAAQSGGFARLESTPGQGTTVCICVPALETAHD